MRMNIVKRDDGALVPSRESDWEKAKLFKVNCEYPITAHPIDIRVLRKKYFVLIKMLFENQDEFKLIRQFRKDLEVRAGHFRLIYFEGYKFKMHESIAYGNMEDEDFLELYKSVIANSYQEHGLDNETIEQNIKNFL